MPRRGQVDGIRSTGAARLMTLRLGVLPQVLPVMLSQALYQLESNSREATILGLVGAGGIGLRLSERIQINAWDQVAYIIVLILITVAAIDFVSKRIRTRLDRGTIEPTVIARRDAAISSALCTIEIAASLR